MDNPINDTQPTDEDVRELNTALLDGKPAAPNPTAEPGDNRVAEDDEEHEGADEPTKVDSELEAAQNDAEREEIRTRRRQERKDKRERQKAKQASLERHVDSLTKQNQQMQSQLKQLMNQSAGAQIAAVDEAIRETDEAVTHFKTVIEDATTKGDGKTLASATEHLVSARERGNQLKQMKQQMGRPQARPAADPVMINHAKGFMAENKWYGGANSPDPDSRVMTAVDNSLAAEGWDPTTSEYWDELRTRATRYLPHRFSKSTASSANSGNNTDTRAARSSPVSGSNGDGNKGNGGETYALSQERVRAIKEAGAWDDPKRRSAMIKRYQEYDKSARS